MEVLKDGSFRVQKGERFPFICPKCMHPIAYAENLAMVKCPKCLYVGMVDHFTKMGLAFLDKRGPDDMLPKLSFPLRTALLLKWFYIDKKTNKFGLWLRLTFYPIMYPTIRLMLWATKPVKQ